MNRRRIGLALLLLLGRSGMATELPPPMPAAALLEQTGRAYVEARDELLEQPELLAAVQAAREATAYGGGNWLPLVLSEALAMHLTHSEEARRLHRLRGLDPDHYLLRRRPEPSTGRELWRLRHVAPLMIELFLKGLDTYEWSSAAAAPAERRALRSNLLMAIGRSDHPASAYFLTHVVEGQCPGGDSCDTAVIALGETGALQALPVLLGVLDGARGNDGRERYRLTVRALGRIRHAAVWPYLQAELQHADARVREAAVRSLGAYGSHRQWTHDPVAAAAIRQAIGSSLVEVLAAAEDQGIVHAAMGSLSSVATPELRDLLRQKLTTPELSTVEATADRYRRALRQVDRVLARGKDRLDESRRVQ